MRATQALAAAVLALATATAFAHKPSDSYLAISVEGTEVKGQWDIALRDLDFAIGLDDNGDGDITWGEVKAQSQRYRRVLAREAEAALGRGRLSPSRDRVPGR